MKNSLIFILLLTIVFFVVPAVPAATINSASLSGIQIFPSDNIWNVPVNTMPVDANSANYINTMGTAAPLSTAFGVGGIPYNIVNKTQQKSKVAFRYYGVSDNVPYPIPANPLIEGSGSVATCEGDCHVLIVDNDSKLLYEIFDLGAQLPNGTWTAGTGAVFNLSNNSLRPKGWSSADAAGLPMLPGLVKYDEVASGSINHAIRFTSSLTQNAYIWPARSESGSANLAYPPMGQRFRLKASFNTTGYSPQAKVILDALKKYGMILADNGPALSISGNPDTRWNLTQLSTLQKVKGSDFEAVDESSLMVNVSSGKTGITTSTSSTTQSLITVTSPNGGEAWTRGTSQTVKWSYTGNPGSLVNIFLLKSGTNVGTIANNVPIGASGSGSYVWPISGSAGLANGSDFKVMIQSVSQPSFSDTSDNYFTINPVPSMTVNSPNGGESWARGTSQTVKWSYTGNPGSLVNIFLLKSGTNVGTIASNVPIGASGSGSYVWPISGSAGLANGSDFKVMIKSVSQPALNDMSNNSFTINPAPTITVTSPNGGESWAVNTNHTVTWTSSGNVGANVKIELLKAGIIVQTLSTATPNDGSAGPWTISPGLVAGTDYRIRITSTTVPTITDTSNGNFAIIAGSVTTSVTVITPNGGESWARMMGTGAPHSVQWSYSGNPGSTVKVELLMGGVPYKVLTPATSIGSAGSGSFSWKISADTALGSNYQIRVTSTSRSTCYDTSNANFIID